MELLVPLSNGSRNVLEAKLVSVFGVPVAEEGIASDTDVP
jgi:hypothetical protein